MAKARVIEPKPVKQPPRKISLELTEGEADFLLAVAARVGGDPERSPRKYNERIWHELYRVLGYDWDGTAAYKLLSSASAGLFFDNYPS